MDWKDETFIKCEDYIDMSPTTNKVESTKMRSDWLDNKRCKDCKSLGSRKWPCSNTGIINCDKWELK